MLTRVGRFVVLLALLGPGIPGAVRDAAGSAVVVLGRPDRVVLATDSLRVTAAGHRDHICKIWRAGRWWLTPGGFTGAGGYTVRAHTSRVLASAPDLATIKAILVGEVYPEIERVFREIAHVDGFASLFKPGMVGSVIVAGVDVDDPRTVRVGTLVYSLKRVAPVEMSASWVTCPGMWCEGDGRVFFGATWSGGPAVDRLVAPRPAWVERIDAQAAHRIIAEQIAATPHEVGGPINVLEITTGGARWFAREAGSRCDPL